MNTITNDKSQKYWDIKAVSNTTFHAEFDIEAFMNILDKSANILDLGCGYGRILNQLEKQGYIKLVGTDMSQEMLNKAARLCPGARLVHHREMELPFQNMEFDAVILSAVLGCIPYNTNQKYLIDEISRILKPNGIIYITDFYINNDERNVNRYSLVKNTDDCPYGVFELSRGVLQRHHSVEYIQNLLSGFKAKCLKSKTFTTMNGHSSKGFIYIGVKA